MQYKIECCSFVFSKFLQKEPMEVNRKIDCTHLVRNGSLAWGFLEHTHTDTGTCYLEIFILNKMIKKNTTVQMYKKGQFKLLKCDKKHFLT